jgi:hypothetical protein
MDRRRHQRNCLPSRDQPDARKPGSWPDQLRPGGLTLNLAAGSPFSGVLGTFTAQPNRAIVGSALDRGDGATQPFDPVLTPMGNNILQVSGSHTYAVAGRYRISLQVTYGQGDAVDGAAFDVLVSTAVVA